MKKIKIGEYKYKVCCVCGQTAYWRSRLLRQTFACQDHGDILIDMERDQLNQDAQLNESDYQTWMRV